MQIDNERENDLVFSVLVVSSDFSSYMRKGNNGVIHSIFKNTINILVDGHILSIHKKTLPLTPLSLKINDYKNSFFEIDIVPGNKVLFYQDKLLINKYCFSLKSAELWNGKLKCGTIIEIDSILMELIIKIFKIYGKSSGIGDFLLDRGKSFEKMSVSFGIPTLYENKWMGREQIFPLNNNWDISEHIKTIISLLGVGPGLTPAGDDFILGFLSVIYRMRQQKTLINAVLNEFRDAILAECCKTTDISKEYLYYGCQGVFGEVFHSLYQAIHDGNKENIFPTVVNLIKTGSTSGSDTLTGIIFGMKFYKEML